MVMELGAARGPKTASKGLGSTYWTTTVPTPFGPAPGGGSLGGMFEEGFAAQPAGSPGEGVIMDPIQVLGRGPFSVKKEPVGPGQIPSMVVRFHYTDRGQATKELLDKQIHGFLKKAGYRVSRATSFKAQRVAWRWEHDKQADFYFPVVASGPLAGMRYAGNAITLPAYEASPNALAALPNDIWTYTFAVTSSHDTMTDGEAAAILTLLKQAMVNMASAGAYARVPVTVRGCPPNIFGVTNNKIVKPVAMGFSAVLLLVAYNMLSVHAGSEVL